MNDLLDKAPREYRPRTFWERPEGVTGQVVGVSILGGAGWLLYHALPLLITLLQNTIYATALGALALALGYTVTDRRF